MLTVPPGTHDSAANGPRRYQIIARCAAVVQGDCLPSAGLPEVLPDVTYTTSGPNVFVFCGVVHDQGALLSILAALVERGLMLQSVRRLEHDELLEPMCGPNA